jgi:hypothetical protein
VVSDGNQDTAQQLSAWALQQQQQQPIARSQRYTVAQQQAAPPVFVTVLQDFLVEQYRLEGWQADVAACAALAAVMAASLAPASWQSYSSMFGLFVRFCISSNVSFLPATPLTGLLWAQHLAEKGTVKASTAQPYFSVVNTIHQLLGHPKPCAANPALTAFRKGWERQQQPLVVEPALAGLALPPRLAYALYLARPSCSTVAALRPVLFSVLSYVLILRPASLLSVVWMRVSDNLLQYKPLHWKGARLLPADAPVLQFPVQSLPFLTAALSRFQQLRGPPGATFRVPLHKVEALGGWTAGSSALRKRYIDHAVPADAHARMFFAALVHSEVASAQLFNT